MSNEDYVLLEWSYTPEMFFEEPVVVSRKGVEIRIEGGTATAKLEPESYDAEHRTREELHEVVRGYFKAEQVMTHQAFTLEKPSVTKMHADGRRDRTVFVEGVTARISMDCKVDVVITRADGTVVDTRKERLDRNREFRELCEKWRNDWLLRRMLASYGAAVNDPEDEFVHLYEIRDALQVCFGKNMKRWPLNIDDDKYSRFEKLLNHREIRQSRHRGLRLRDLRDATATELEEARALAREFVEAYVRWLDGGRGV